MCRLMDRMRPHKYKTWLLGQPLVQVSWVIKGKSFATLRLCFITFKWGIWTLKSFSGLIFCASGNSYYMRFHALIFINFSKWEPLTPSRYINLPGVCQVDRNNVVYKIILIFWLFLPTHRTSDTRKGFAS